MILKKENAFALIIALDGLFLEYRSGVSFEDPFTFFPLLAFGIIVYANYMSQFPPSVWGQRGHGAGTWYENTYSVLSLKFLGWILLAVPLLALLIFPFFK